jgi:hypothetical protein
MDYFQKACVIDFTAYDLNCSCVRSDHSLGKKFRRKARRRLKQDLTNSDFRSILESEIKKRG